ncbi:HDOD domain-containing protein [Hydrogenimonas cancrithermarum]|uniref:HDOD domain-containing protein n=1 Tax=Hydrogenimonas cancrithermarum TaxID=2993563 RepID=A0ABN6WWR7_9BACT|nr:HDOD domain-containing protein [Hydrogenimonas cancrithermarum]BDY12682.1 hypothetical protein HCR_09940 [Hydrogenimonas cancrithermarum]
MVTPQQIDIYLQRVPPLPESLQKSLNALEKGNLAAAAKAAASDAGLIGYLKRVVNSAAYGFRNRVNDPAQIFSALGVERAKELLYAYMVSRIAPEKWRYFALSNDDFTHFQTALMHKWEMLVRHESADEKFLSAAAVMSGGLVVADAVFGEHASDVALLRESGDYDLDTILERVSHLRFEQLVAVIAKKWEVDEDVIRLVRLAFGNLSCMEAKGDDTLCRLARLLHLLLFYELSRPIMLEAGANAFISFNPEFATPALETFENVIGIE